MPLQKIGVEAVVENLPGFQKALETIDKVVQQASSSISKSADASVQFGKSLDSSVDNVKLWQKGLAQAEATMRSFDAKRLAGVDVSKSEIDQYIRASRAADAYSTALSHTAVGTASAAESTTGLALALGAAGVVIGIVTTAVGALVAGIGALVDLAQRGAALTGITQGFYNLSAAVGVSATALMDDMHKASAGAISDIDLMTRANLALTGVTREVGAEFAKSLPTLLEFARKQAMVTGESFDYLYDSLVKGIKRSSVRIIDNAGLVLRVSEANKQYAESVGKTVEQLTAQETQLALMRATVEAAQLAMENLGNIHETAEIKIQRMGATVENTMNTLSAAIQPAFESILDGLQPIFDFISNLAADLAPYIQALAEMFGQLVTAILGPIGDALKGINTAQLAKAFFKGGARMIGALAGGMAAAARATIIPVIKAIAKAIASFLSGFSPPPEGPLHTIDIGGAKVMEAWLEGFMGVSLQPVSVVAGQVMNMMGSIWTASRQYVESRLKALDAALQPFEDRLTIVRAKFDALKDAADIAFNRIDKSMERALDALNKGVAGSDAMVRSLDNQRTALEGYIEAQQYQIDNAQIQLSLAKAQQAEERAMLEIRKRILGPEEKVAAAKEKAAEAAKAKKGGGKGEAEAPAGGGRKGPSDAEAAMNALEVAMAGQEMSTSFQEGFAGAGGDIQGLQQDIIDIGASGASIQDSLKRIGDKIRNLFGEGFDPSKITGDLLNRITSFAWGVADNFLNALRDRLAQFVLNTVLGGFIGLQIPQSAIDWGAMLSGVLANLIVVGPQLIGNTMNTVLSLVGIGLPQGTSVNDLIQGIIDWLTQGAAMTLINAGLKLIRSAFEITISEGPIAWLMEGGVQEFISAIGAIVDAISTWVTSVGKPILTQIGVAIATFLSNPFSAIGTAMKRAVVAGLRAILKIVKDSHLTDFIPQLGALVNALDVALAGAAGGGVFSKGLLRVGERGPEVISSASKLAVFPNKIVKLLDSLDRVMANPSPMYVPSYGATYNQQQSNSWGDVNFNGVQGTNDAMHRYALLRAMGRMK